MASQNTHNNNMTDKQEMEEVRDAWINLGYLLSEKNDFAGAENAFKNALKIDPNHAKATNGMCACVLMMCECARKTPSKRHSKSTRNTPTHGTIWAFC